MKAIERQLDDSAYSVKFQWKYISDYYFVWVLNKTISSSPGLICFFLSFIYFSLMLYNLVKRLCLRSEPFPPYKCCFLPSQQHFNKMKVSQMFHLQCRSSPGRIEMENKVTASVVDVFCLFLTNTLTPSGSAFCGFPSWENGIKCTLKIYQGLLSPVVIKQRDRSEEEAGYIIQEPNQFKANKLNIISKGCLLIHLLGICL